MPPAPSGRHPPTIHHPVGAGHARLATLRRRLLLVCIVGRGLDPSAGRRGRRPLQGWPENKTSLPRILLPNRIQPFQHQRLAVHNIRRTRRAHTVGQRAGCDHRRVG